MGRTNIDIDDDLMAAAMKATGQTTTKGTVEQAMRQLIKATAFRELVTGMRGIDWDDGLSATSRGRELAEGPMPFDAPARKR